MLFPKGTGACAPRFALLLLLPAIVYAATTMAEPLVLRYRAGDDYRTIPEPIDRAGDRIPVIEFFLYSCPHCYAFDSDVTQWRNTLPPNVAFRRVPVVFGNNGRFYARLFYTEKALGVFDRLHGKIFDAIHRQGRDLSTLAAARAFFAAHGVSGERFAKIFNSPAIDRKVAHAIQLARAFRVRAVPSIGVAGRYWITGAMAGSNKAMLAVAGYLVSKLRSTPASAR